VVERFARILELIISFIALSGARALSGGLRTSVLHLLGFIPDDFAI
jgi:hypothetical protein